MSLVVALSTVLGFTVIDHWLLVGPRLARPDIWRFGLQLPLVLIMMGLTSPRLYLRWYQPAIQVAAPLFGVGTVLMAVEATPAQLPLVAARLLLAAFYFYFMLGLSFSAALRSNLLLIAAYATAALLGRSLPRSRSTRCSSCCAPTSSAAPAATRSSTPTASPFSSAVALRKWPPTTASPDCSTARRSKSRRAACGSTRRWRACRCRCC